MNVDGPKSPNGSSRSRTACLKPDLRGALLERVALGGVAGDAVEHGAEDLRRVQTLSHHGLVDEQLHHHQLVDRHARDALEQDLEALVELLARRRTRSRAPTRPPRCRRGSRR